MLKMKILKEKNKNDQEIFNRKGPMILKTKLKNVPISDKLRNWKPQNFSELINQPFPNKTSKFSSLTIKTFKDSLKSNILTNSFIGKTLSKMQDPNRTQAGMNIILNLKNRNSDIPQGKFLDLTQAKISYNENNNFRLKEFCEEEQMKILLKENYSNYTIKLKKLYPKFQFNHYYVTRSELIENYYRKYGEEGDINNRNFANKKLLSEKNKIKNNKNNSSENENFIKIEEEKYTPSNLLDILGVQENVKISPNKFKIKQDFLSRPDVVEINMIQNDLAFKMGIINKELDSILQQYGKKIYNYTEKNSVLKTQIEEYLKSMKSKKQLKKEINKKYIDNSSRLIMKGLRKCKIKKILNYLYTLKKIKNDVDNLDIILSSDDYFEIKNIGNKINEIREKLKQYKENFNTKTKIKILKSVENKIKLCENKTEERMFDQFTLNIEKLLNICLIYKSADFDALKKSGEIDLEKNSKEKNIKWNLEKEKETKNKFFFMNEDFELIETHTNKFIKYLLIYNNLNTKLIYNLLLSILDMFDTIIKEGMDMSIITIKYKEILRKIIVNNFDLIEKESNNKLVIIYIISNCYTILLSNYFYLIELLQKNFGLNIKIFNEVTQVIREEMDKFISIVILAYLHDVMFDHEYSEFLAGLKLAKKYCYMYLSNGYTNLNYENVTNDVYQEYINYFDTTETKKLKEKISKINLEPITNIENKYQQMFEVLYTSRSIESLSPEQIDIKKIYQDNKENNNDNKEKKEYIIIIESNEEENEEENNNNINNDNNNDNNKTEEIERKQKISELSLLYIKYTYQILNIFVSTSNDDLKDNVVNNLFKTTKDILIQTNNDIINNNTNNPLAYKKIALYSSDLTVMENSLCSILDLYENEELELLFKDIHQSAIDFISHSIGIVVSTIISNFNSLEFDKYNILGENEKNNFALNFGKIHTYYKDVINCVLSEDLNNIFEKVFDNLFDEINKIIKNKGKIKKEDELNQCKKDFDYIKENLKNYEDINIEKYLNIIEQIENDIDGINNDIKEKNNNNENIQDNNTKEENV